jgi:hypothetical protein
MTRVRRLLVLLATLLAVVLTAGCGGAGTSLGGESLTPEQLRQAASASVDAQSSRFALDLDLTLPGAPGSFAFSGEGAFDSAGERATISLDLSSLAGLFGGLMGGLGGGFTPGQAPPDFQRPEAWKLDAIVDGQVVYVRFPALASELPEGKSWVRMDAADQGKTAQDFGFSGLEDFTNEDPRALLEVLESVSGEIETVGTEELRGAQTTHYRATLDVRDLGGLAPKAQGQSQELGEMLDQLVEQAGLSAIPFDVWLDEEGLVRKVEASVSVAPPGESDPLEASLAFELYDYGLEVDVTPPPADEVVDASTLSG